MTTGIEQARRLIAEERERKTGFLDLGNLGLAELPDDLFELTHSKGLTCVPHGGGGLPRGAGVGSEVSDLHSYAAGATLERGAPSS